MDDTGTRPVPGEDERDPTTAAPTPAATGHADVPADVPAADYDESGVPTFEHVRDKIEGRYAAALGAEELAAETPAGRSLAEQEAARAEAAQAKLAELRRSVRGDG
jgi:phage shock protein A